jgi:branched-chain amino acid aminotransferase
LLLMKLPYSEADLVTLLFDLLRAEEIKTDCYIRPLAFFADETLGVRLHGLSPVVSIVAFPFGKYIDNDEGAHVTISSWRRIDDNMIPARGKITGAYINSALSKSDAHLAGFDDAILLNQEGRVSEGPTANLFLARGGVVVTPPVTDDILEGIVRRTLISLLRDEIGVTVVERSIDRSELFVADEAFFAGTGMQIVPITRIDHRPVGYGRPGNLTTNLRSLYFDVVRGRVAKYRSWCAPVYAPVSAAVSA